jgi:hypothetical protein
MNSKMKEFLLQEPEPKTKARIRFRFFLSKNDRYGSGGSGSTTLPMRYIYTHLQPQLRGTAKLRSTGTATAMRYMVSTPMRYSYINAVRLGTSTPS